MNFVRKCMLVLISYSLMSELCGSMYLFKARPYLGLLTCGSWCCSCTMVTPTVMVLYYCTDARVKFVRAFALTDLRIS